MQGRVELVRLNVCDDGNRPNAHEHGGVTAIAERNKPSHEPDAGRPVSLCYVGSFLAGALPYCIKEAVNA